MNKIILMGRLARDPESRKSASGNTVTSFVLAVDRPFKAENGKKEADFINIVTWNRTAEAAFTYLHKGQRALVEGRLQIRSYDGKDGNKHYVTEVICNNLEFIEKKGTGDQKNPGAMGSFGEPMKFDEEVPF